VLPEVGLVEGPVRVARPRKRLAHHAVEAERLARRVPRVEVVEPHRAGDGARVCRGGERRRREERREDEEGLELHGGWHILRSSAMTAMTATKRPGVLELRAAP